MAALTAPKLSLLLVLIAPLVLLLLLVMNRRTHPLFTALQALPGSRQWHRAREPGRGAAGEGFRARWV